MFYDKNVVKLRDEAIALPVEQTIDVNGLFIGKILSLMTAGCQVLDIGTGNGFVLKQIHNRCDIACTLTGVDNSAEMVKVAKENLGDKATIVEGDNDKLPFSDEAFDIVTAKNVTRFNAEELHRVLKKGGMFVFREYGPAKGMIEIAEIFTDRLIRSREITYYIDKLEKSGFKIVNVQKYVISRNYHSVDEIVRITKSFPFIRDYSDEDEELIRQKLRGNSTITSDPFILVAQRK